MFCTLTNRYYQTIWALTKKIFIPDDPTSIDQTVQNKSKENNKKNKNLPVIVLEELVQNSGYRISFN